MPSSLPYLIKSNRNSRVTIRTLCSSRSDPFHVLLVQGCSAVGAPVRYSREYNHSRDRTKMFHLQTALLSGLSPFSNPRAASHFDHFPLSEMHKDHRHPFTSDNIDCPSDRVGVSKCIHTDISAIPYKYIDSDISVPITRA